MRYLIAFILIGFLILPCFADEIGIYAGKEVNGDMAYQLPYTVIELGGNKFKLADNYLAPRNNIFSPQHYGLSIEWIAEVALRNNFYIAANTGVMYKWDDGKFDDWITGLTLKFVY